MNTRIASEIANSKKLQENVFSLGLNIKESERKIDFLKHQKVLADDAIQDMQVEVGNYHGDDDAVEKVVRQILKNGGNSAAAIVCRLRERDHHPTWFQDVVGVVATLATVQADSLSRVLSEYLGLETMTAVVCKTLTCARDLESYAKDGLGDTSSGFRPYGASLEGPSVIICLENMRPYVGDFVANNPQKRLDLLKPKLPNGETPPGFLGFAVNMINIEPARLSFVTPHGHGLRETLFFNLFSRLQVYETRDQMLQALPLIVDGAVSLDGGIMKSRDIFWLRGGAEASLGFPVWILPEADNQNETAMKKEKWRRERLVDDLCREQEVLDQTKLQFEMKKQEYAEAKNKLAFKLLNNLDEKPFL